MECFSFYKHLKHNIFFSCGVFQNDQGCFWHSLYNICLKRIYFRKSSGKYIIVKWAKLHVGRPVTYMGKANHYCVQQSICKLVISNNTHKNLYKNEKQKYNNCIQVNAVSNNSMSYTCT